MNLHTLQAPLNMGKSCHGHEGANRCFTQFLATVILNGNQKCTIVKEIIILTCSRNLSILSQLVCPNKSVGVGRTFLGVGRTHVNYSILYVQHHHSVDELQKHLFVDSYFRHISLGYIHTYL